MKKWFTYTVVAIIMYINSIAYGIICSYNNVFLGLWGVSHYILYSIQLMTYYNIYKGVDFKKQSSKIISVINIIIGFVILILGWNISTHKFFSETFILILLGQLSLITISFYMMHYTRCNSLVNGKKIESNIIPKISIKEGIDFSKKVVDEKGTYAFSDEGKIIKCTLITLLEFIAIVILYVIVPAIIKHAENRINIIYFSMVIVTVFLFLNLKKNRWYYGCYVYKRKTIINTLLIIAGLSFLYYFQGIVYYNSDTTNFYVYIVPIITVYKVIDVNHSIIKKYARLVIKNKEQ